MFDCGAEFSALVAPSSECLRGEGLVRLIGAVVSSLASAAGPVVCQRVQSTAALALQPHCIISTCSVECYWHCSDVTVHYKSDETVNFCRFRCANTSPITVFINFVFNIYMIYDMTSPCALM